MKNNLISTPKILLITSLIILSTIGLTLLVQKYIPKIKTTLTREVSKQSLKNNEPEVLESPKYLLEVTKKAEYILGPCFSMAVKINNISVEPFITDVGFDNCSWIVVGPNILAVWTLVLIYPKDCSQEKHHSSCLKAVVLAVEALQVVPENQYL